MKKYFYLLAVCIPFVCSAQNQGNIWCFGEESGLDFSSGSPIAISEGQTGTDSSAYSQEGTAVISDSTGSILFYSGGHTVWNRNHERMPNGNDISGGQSSTHSSIIVPKPGDENLFYLFTSDHFLSYYSETEKGYNYSIIDMCLDNGDGDVIADQKNIALADSSTEKLSVCMDNEGTGYWIVGHKMFSDQFMAWHLTSSGLSDPVISTIGTIHGWSPVTSTWNPGRALGQMKFNSTGTKLALAIGNSRPAIVDLFDFDLTTGLISNNCYIAIDSSLNKRVYGVEFSPDDTKLYATVSGGSGGKRLYQYDLTADGGTCSAIIDSRLTIFQSNVNSVMNGMQLGPDDKIYIVCNEYSDIGCINYPNLMGDAVEFDSLAVVISGVKNSYTFPSFIANYEYMNTMTTCQPTSLAISSINNKLIAFYPSPIHTIGTLKINSEMDLQNLEIYIYDALGRVRYQTAINEYETTINLERLASGIYFYRLSYKLENIKTGRVIIE
ncbi:MAG: hypothetical protein ACI8ZM_002727 [Crocinitomix sp.]|jgi:hypothetical protein